MQFQKFVTRYKKHYNMDIRRQTACMFVNLIMVDNFVFSFIAQCWVGPQTKSRLPSQSVSDGLCLTINVFFRANRGPVRGFCSI